MYKHAYIYGIVIYLCIQLIAYCKVCYWANVHAVIMYIHYMFLWIYYMCIFCNIYSRTCLMWTPNQLWTKSCTNRFLYIYPHMWTNLSCVDGGHQKKYHRLKLPLFMWTPRKTRNILKFMQTLFTFNIQLSKFICYHISFLNIHCKKVFNARLFLYFPLLNYDPLDVLPCK